MTDKEDIYDLGFETLELEITNKRRDAFFLSGVHDGVVDDTNRYLINKYQALKSITSHTTCPEKLVQMHNSGLRIIKVRYIQIWNELAYRNSVTWKDFFLHYIVFNNQEELDFYKLVYKNSY